MSTALKIPPEAITMAGRVGREVRLIFAERNAAQRFMTHLTTTREGWKPSDTFMSPRSSWPQRRKRITKRSP